MQSPSFNMLLPFDHPPISISHHFESMHSSKLLRHSLFSYTNSPLHFLHDSILLNILDRLSHPFDRLAWSLSCKHFFLLEASCRTRLSVFRTHAFPSLARRYPLLQHLDLSPCTSLTDERLHSIALSIGKRLLSLNLTKVRTFSDFGLLHLAKECTSLLDLDLSQCLQVQDLGIMAIAHIRTLQSVKLKGCRHVTDSSLIFLASKCKNLRSLSVKWCIGITDHAFIAIGQNCFNLRELDASYTEIKNTGLSEISKLKNLEKLSLIACNCVNDEGLAHLKNGSKSLQNLDLSRCRSITSTGVMGLANRSLPLKHVMLSYCFSMKDAMPQNLFKFKDLQSIRFDGCDVSNVNLGSLSKCCTTIKDLSFSKCKGFTDAGLSAAVLGCFGLEKIDLTCCRQVTDIGLSSIAASCKGLISLKMESCTEITEHGLRKLCESCLSLEELDFTDSNVDDAGLMSVAKCNFLKVLKLGFCESIHDKGLMYIASKCSNLRELDLYRSVEISDLGVAAVSKGCTSLTSLNLSYCTKITDLSLFAVARLRDLSTLEVRSCSEISSLGVLAVAKRCRRLVELDIKRCTSIEDFVPLAVAQCCKNLKQINLSYCVATDEGVVALAKLNCMQNMRLIHVKNVSVEGFSELLLAGESLKKVKLLVHLKEALQPAVIEQVQMRGCRFKWLEKL